MSKGVIFWVVWVAVVAGAGVAYFTLVHPKVGENQTKLEHRDLLAARLTELKKTTSGLEEPSAKIRSIAGKLARNEKLSAVEEKEKPQLFPENLVPGEVDARICYLYPLHNNLRNIPNASFVDAKKKEDEDLLAERERFVKRFGTMQFAVDTALAPKTNKDFDPAPPADPDIFRQWVMGKDGQDRKIDQLFEEKAGKGGIKVCESRIGAPGTSCDWLDDGRCSGYIDDRSREQVLKRLVLRKLILMAVARAEAPVNTLVKEKYDKDKKKLDQQWDRVNRRVQMVEVLTFLEGDLQVSDPGKGFQAARNSRFGMASLQPPAKEKIPYRPNGFSLRVKCHLAVVPALLRELETIGQPDKSDPEKEVRPFTCWVERLLVERPTGRPDWRQEDPVPRDLPVDGGHRYLEWPVSVDILAVVPKFEEKEDPAP